MFLCVVGLYVTEKSNRKNKQLMANERPGGRCPNSTLFPPLFFLFLLGFRREKRRKKKREAFPNCDVKIQKENRK